MHITHLSYSTVLNYASFVAHLHLLLSVTWPFKNTTHLTESEPDVSGCLKTHKTHLNT